MSQEMTEITTEEAIAIGNAIIETIHVLTIKAELLQQQKIATKYRMCD